MLPAGPQVPHADASTRGAMLVVRLAIFLAGIAAGPAIVASLNQVECLRFLTVSEVIWAVPLAWVAFAWIAPTGRTSSQVLLRCLCGGTVLGLVCSTLVWLAVAPQRTVQPESALMGAPIGFCVAVVCLWPAMLCNARQIRASLNSANRAVLGASLWLIAVSLTCVLVSAPTAWRLLPCATLLLGLIGSAVGQIRAALLRKWVDEVRESRVPGWQIRELTWESTNDLPLVFPAPAMCWFDLLVRTNQGHSAYRSPADGAAVALIPRSLDETSN